MKDNFPSSKSNPQGRVNIDEILSLPDLQTNPLVKRVLSIFDTNKDKTIDLDQFIKALSTLYGEDEETKIKFAF